MAFSPHLLAAITRQCFLTAPSPFRGRWHYDGGWDCQKRHMHTHKTRHASFIHSFIHSLPAQRKLYVVVTREGCRGQPVVFPEYIMIVFSNCMAFFLIIHLSSETLRISAFAKKQTHEKSPFSAWTLVLISMRIPCSFVFSLSGTSCSQRGGRCGRTWKKTWSDTNI